MEHVSRIRFTPRQRAELWERWRAAIDWGQSLFGGEKIA